MMLTYGDRGSIGWALRIEVGGDTKALAPALPSLRRVRASTILSFDKDGSWRVGSRKCKSY